MPHDATPVGSEQTHPRPTKWASSCSAFSRPVPHARLSAQLPPGGTFVQTLQALLVWRHCNLGLLLSELGSYRAKPGHASAGTKRVSNLLHVLASRSDPRKTVRDPRIVSPKASQGSSAFDRAKGQPRGGFLCAGAWLVAESRRSPTMAATLAVLERGQREGVVRVERSITG
jgi:hypothetical protein